MEKRSNPLYLLRPHGDHREVEAVREVIESGWWGKGPKVDELEAKFADMVSAKYAVAVTSASAGLDLALKVYGIKDCDVVNPTVSFIATAVIPLWNNCTSNIVDVDRRTLNLDPEDVRQNLKPNTGAILAVNMAGIPAPIDELRGFFDGLIIEDCAHSCYTPGAGSKGDIAVWSFQAVKTMPCGDGGMITTNNRSIYEKLTKAIWFGVPSTHSRTKKGKYLWDYDVDSVGYKYYMIDINAAIVLAQMEKLERHLEIRRHIQKRYNEELHEAVGRPEWSETVQYYCARVPANTRNELVGYLADKNIHTSVHFKPLHLHSIFNMSRKYPVADDEWQKLITLPVHPAISDGDINYVIYWVKRFFDEHVYP
jgi:perosamine synthetase